MARKKSDVAVIIKPEADFDQARQEIAAGFQSAEQVAKAAVGDMEKAVAGAKLSPDVDLSGLDRAETAYQQFAAQLRDKGLDVQVNDDDLRRAFDLAGKLENATAKLTIDTDASELQSAEKLAQSLRSFTGRINLDVQGRAELRDALGITEQLDSIRRVKIDVQGRQDLERAEALAAGLEEPRQINLKPPAAGDLSKIEDEVAGHGGGAAEKFSEKFGEFNFSNLGDTAAEGIIGGLSAGGPWIAAAGAVAALFGDSFAEGFNDGWNRKKDDTLRALSSGLDTAGLRKAGAAGGAAFADGFGESLSGLKDTAATLQSELGGIDNSLDLTVATKEAQALEQVFGIELPESVKLVRRLVANGLVPDAVTGFNLIAQGASDAGVEAADFLDVANEFAPVFSKLGVDGAQAFSIMATEVKQGLIPTIDRAAEQFQEFRIRLEAGDSRAAIEGIGVDFDKLQQKLAAGKGDEALAQLSRSLLQVGNEAQRNAAFVEIFGASVEDVSDPKRVLELLATADAVGTIGTKAEDAAKKLADTQTSFDKIQRVASQTGSALGAGADLVLSGVIGDMDSANNAFLNFTSIVGGAIPSVGRWSDRMRDAQEAAKDTANSTAAVNDALDAGTGAFDKTSKAANGLAGSAGKAADKLGKVKLSADELRDALEGVFNFSFDQQLRAIAEQGDKLGESFQEASKKVVGLHGSIDITRKGGAALQETFEDLNGSVINAASAYRSGAITADQYATVQRAINTEFDAAARAAGLTAGQIDGLREKYLAIPKSIQTEIGVNVGAATREVLNLQAELAKLPTTKTITIQTRNAVIAATAQTTILGRETGGPARGLTLVGEKGPELVDFGTSTAYVYNNQQTRSLLAGASATAHSTAVTAPGQVGRSALIENATIMVAPGRPLFAELASAEAYFRAVA